MVASAVLPCVTMTTGTVIHRESWAQISKEAHCMVYLKLGVLALQMPCTHTPNHTQ